MEIIEKIRHHFTRTEIEIIDDVIDKFTRDDFMRRLHHDDDEFRLVIGYEREDAQEALSNWKHADSDDRKVRSLCFRSMNFYVYYLAQFLGEGIMSEPEFRKIYKKWLEIFPVKRRSDHQSS